MFVVRTRRRKYKPFRRGIKAHVKQGDVWTTCVCRHTGEDAEVIAKVKTHRVIVYRKQTERNNMNAVYVQQTKFEDKNYIFVFFICCHGTKASDLTPRLIRPPH